MERKIVIKQNTRKIKSIITAILVVIVLCVSLFITNGDKFDIPTWNELFTYVELIDDNSKNYDDLNIEFLDVGQGDSTLIYTKNMAVIIDSGEKENGEFIVEHINKLGIDKIDLVIATHPHSDHIGSFPHIFNSLKCDNVIMPKLPKSLVPTTATYMNFLNSIKDNGVKASYANVNDSFEYDGVKITVLGPISNKSDLNNSSLVIRVDYGTTSFLIGGDAEREVEKELIKAGVNLNVDVLHCGHHGSKYSSCDEFMNSTSPEYAIISCGAENSYGHPNEEVLTMLNKRDIDYYRTDINGTIVCNSDGKNITFKEK